MWVSTPQINPASESGHPSASNNTATGPDPTPLRTYHLGAWTGFGFDICSSTQSTRRHGVPIGGEEPSVILLGRFLRLSMKLRFVRMPGCRRHGGGQWPTGGTGHSRRRRRSSGQRSGQRSSSGFTYRWLDMPVLRWPHDHHRDLRTRERSTPRFAQPDLDRHIMIEIESAAESLRLPRRGQAAAAGFLAIFESTSRTSACIWSIARASPDRCLSRHC
jgi:hypothetical protein